MASAGKPTNEFLNELHVAFNIISFCMSVAGSIIFAVSISYFYEIQYKRCYLWGYFGQMWERYRRCLKNTAHWQVGVAFFTILLLCMLTEFIIALTAFMYWYKAGCNGCCKVAAPGVVIAQPPAQQHRTIQTSAASPYSNAGYLILYQASTGYNPQQPQFIAPSGYSHAPASTKFSSAQGMPPPSYPVYDQSDVETGHYEPPPAYH